MPKLIKKDEMPVPVKPISDTENIESAIEITAEKLNKAYNKKANLEADIASMELSMELLKRELE